MTKQTLRKAYRIASSGTGLIAIAYLLLLYFPQPLFAYSTEYERFKVYSREPIEPEIAAVLDSAEARLKRSPIYDADVARPVYLTNSFGMYALLSHKVYRSFANSVPFIENIFINKTDIPADRVFVNREKNNSRSLSGVIAHEVTHLLIQRRYGTLRSLSIPAWKKEGYCEYIAGDSTITLDEGLRLWRESPSDDTGYRYIKYHAMMKYLLEKENMSVDDLFKRDLDENEIAEKTFASIATMH